MSVEIKIPEVGESITEAILVEWLVEDGATVEVDDPLFELETDKVTLPVTAEVAGTLSIQVPGDTTVNIGQVVGTIEPAGSNAAADPDPDAGDGAAGDDAADVTADLEEDLLKLADAEDLSGLSPAVRRLVTELDLDPTEIDGSGKGGRILKADVLAHQARLAETASGEPVDVSDDVEPEEEEPMPPVVKPTDTQPTLDVGDLVQVAAAAGQPDARQSRNRMSSLRQRIAQRLVAAQQDAAILTTFNEVDMSGVFAARKRYKEAFEERHGVRLGVMSFFVKAAVDALKTVPEVNVSVDGDELVTHHFFDIGVAVSTDRGLLVPVVRNADQLSFAGIEASIADLAHRAQARTLGLDELTGGVFTVSNGGVFGSLMSTPILNPPQSAILGMHGIKKRPVVVDDEIVIRPMMYLALSYDHRVIDGREAVTFLRRVVDCIENPERMLLEV